MEKMKRKTTFIIGALACALSTSASVYVSEILPKIENVGERDIKNGEYLEIYNSSDSVVSLKKWKIETFEKSFTFEDNQKIEPNGVIVVCYSGSANNKFDLSKKYPKTKGVVFYTSEMNTERGCVKLKNGKGEIVDSFQINAPTLGQPYNRDSVVVDANGLIVSKKSNFSPAEATPGMVERITETSSSVINFKIDDVEDGNENFAITMVYASHTIENEDVVAEEISDRQELTDTFTISATPNPVSTILNIKIEAEKEGEYRYSVQQPNGTILSQGKMHDEAQIDMSRYPTGSYILYIENENQKKSILINKQ